MQQDQSTCVDANAVDAAVDAVDAVDAVNYAVANNCICPADVISGSLITKDKRHEMFGQINGGAGACNPERYQRLKIEEGTGLGCSKTNMRINLRTHTLEDIAHPNKANNGYDYTEDFDGIQLISPSSSSSSSPASAVVPVYINFKSIVGKGGTQTRSLREVYWFIDGQLEILARNGCENDVVCFANILDGDEAHAAMSKFEYLKSLPKFTNLPAIKNNIYVGDLKGYFEWFKMAWLARAAKAMHRCHLR
jgi:hypothetical protein